MFVSTLVYMNLYLSFYMLIYIRKCTFVLKCMLCCEGSLSRIVELGFLVLSSV
jgi:hypothetical protein